MKTDALYLNLFETVPALALHLAGFQVERADEYECHSQELKKAFRVDIVLTPPDTSLPLILAEVQFQREADIYDRIVASGAIMRLQSPEYRDMRMVIFFASRSVDTGAGGVWQPLVDAGVIHVVYLDEASQGTRQTNFTPEEQAALLLVRVTVSPDDRAGDDAILRAFGTTLEVMKSPGRRRLFLDLFVSLYFSKYKTLTIEEIRAMIDSREIFDDIGESVAVQQYAREYAQELVEKSKRETVRETMRETVLALLTAGSTPEYIASALRLPLEHVEEIAAEGGL
jgi:predicted transposase/invertase (TIGR01784 family)